MPGGALGEHLGWLLQGIWAVGVAVLALRAARVPRWFATLGLVAAAAWALAVPTAIAVGPEPLECWGLNLYPAWYLWRMAFGMLLLRRSYNAARQPDHEQVRSAGRSLAS